MRELLVFNLIVLVLVFFLFFLYFSENKYLFRLRLLLHSFQEEEIEHDQKKREIDKFL